MISDVKQVLDDSGIKVASWVVTGTIVVVAAGYLYTRYLEAKKLKIDYLISQYQLDKLSKEQPEFTPVKGTIKEQLDKIKKTASKYSI
jgi:hypothetical protein